MRARIFFAAIVLASPLLPTSMGSAGGPRCFGRQATIVRGGSDNIIDGTNGADVIVAGGGSDFIDAKGGNDRVCGNGGQDSALGGPGDDRINGGPSGDPGLGEAEEQTRSWVAEAAISCTPRGTMRPTPMGTSCKEAAVPT